MDKVRDIMKRWNALQPLSERDRELLSRRFTIDFNYNSNHMEGNTLTYGQTEILLLFGKIIGEAEAKDVIEMTASNVGLRMMTEAAKLKDIPLTQNFICTLHKTLLREDYTVYKNLPGGQTTSYTIHAGRYKTRPNSVITRYGDRFEYAFPEETPALMADLVEWYNKAEQSGRFTPVELAALFHYRYIRIHPFEDGNGRIARLIMNYILARHGYPLIVVPTNTKQEYLSALSSVDAVVGKQPTSGARASLSQIQPFVSYLEKLMTVEMKTDIAIVQGSGGQWWFNGGLVSFNSSTVEEIIHEIHADPHISIRALADRLSINSSAIQKHIKMLKDKGYLIREGSVTRGAWRVLLTKL